jgi:hypothetical protein
MKPRRDGEDELIEKKSRSQVQTAEQEKKRKTFRCHTFVHVMQD